MNRQEALEQFINKHPRKSLRHEHLDWMYMVGGSGTGALLLLPGALNSAELGFEHVEILERDFRVIAPAYPAAATSMHELTGGVVAILDAEGIRRAHVVGSSFGGTVAQCLIRKHPERIGKLVLSHTGGPDAARADKNLRILRKIQFMPAAILRYLMKIGMRRASSRFQEDQEFWTKYLVEGVRQIQKVSFVNFYKRAVDYDRNYRFTPSDLPDAASRVLLLDSDDDPLAGPEVQKSLRALYPGAKVHTFEDTGHLASILKPGEYAEAVRTFLSESE